MQIRNIVKGFEAFESDLKYSNANSNNSIGIRIVRIQIRTIRKGFEAFKCKFEPFESFKAYEY